MKGYPGLMGCRSWLQWPNLSISIKMKVCVRVCFVFCLCVCVCVCVCSSITLERLERFQPNLVHILLYVCLRILCIYYIYISQGGWCGRPAIWMIHIVEEIKLLLLLDNRLKHIRGNVLFFYATRFSEK
jgi:hypothetical protein